MSGEKAQQVTYLWADKWTHHSQVSAVCTGWECVHVCVCVCAVCTPCVSLHPPQNCPSTLRGEGAGSQPLCFNPAHPHITNSSHMPHLTGPSPPTNGYALLFPPLQRQVNKPLTPPPLPLPGIEAPPILSPSALTTFQRMIDLSADPVRHCEKCSLKRQTYTALECPFITACLVNTYLSEATCKEGQDT